MLQLLYKPLQEETVMKTAAFALCGVILLVTPVSAGETQGSVALALAAQVGENMLHPGNAANEALLEMFNGMPKAGPQIRILADNVVCRAGNVDITHHACDINFRGRTFSLNGRRAHELYATLLEAGVVGEGAAGTMHAQMQGLNCVVEPREVADRAGGGAKCTWRDQ